MVDNVKTRIRELIKASGYKQNEIAKHIGVTPQAITKWLRNGNIDKTNLQKLCRLTNSNIDWVLEGRGTMLRKETQGIKETSAPYSMEDVEFLNEYHKLSPADQARLRAIAEALNTSVDNETGE